MNEGINRWKEQYDNAQMRKWNKALKWLRKEASKMPEVITDEYIKEHEDGRIN